MKSVDYLRNKYPFFTYQSFDYHLKGENLSIDFYFQTQPDFDFKHSLVIKNIPGQRFKNLPTPALNNLIFNLGLIELFSYWKATTSPTIKIKAGPLSKAQTTWWKNLLLNGMGEFFFTNNIDFTKKDFIKIQAPDHKGKIPLYQPSPDSKGVLVPVGGGKDSLVSLETLKKAGQSISTMAVNPVPAIAKTDQIAEPQNSIQIQRRIDPKLIELNQQGFLNGHTPFSAMLAFTSLLVTCLFDLNQVAMSQEQSANEEHLIMFGRKINHQYSKSFEFENDFIQYKNSYLAPKVQYYSLIRPLHELQVAQLFAQYKKYHSSFSSCNRNFTIKNQEEQKFFWCNQCPKCLFVFMMLFPFLTEEEIKKIFGLNLFTKPDLLPLMKELIGEGKHKPLECVGTAQESLVAFNLAYLKLSQSNPQGKKWPLIKYFIENTLPNYPNINKLSKKVLTDWNKNHNLPSEISNLLKQDLNNLTLKSLATFKL